MKQIVCWLITFSAFAQESDLHFDVLKTLDGHSFTNATIARSTHVFAVVDFDGGGVKIAITNLPLSLQKKLNYDPSNAAVELELADKKKREERRAQEENAAEAEENRKDKLFRYVHGELVPISAFEWQSGEITQVLTNGILLYRHPPSNVEGTVFIHCPVEGLADDQHWSAWCYPDGVYKYETVRGSVATVQKFDSGLTYLTRSDELLKFNPSFMRRPSRRRTTP